MLFRSAADSNLGGIDCGYTLSLTAIQGNDKTIKLDTDIKAYAVKITDNKGGSANTVEFENVDNYKYRTAFDKVKGVGLINCSTYALTVDSLNLSGKISVKTYNNDGKSYVNEDLSTGGIVGGVQGQCKFSGIALNDLEVSGAYTVVIRSARKIIPAGFFSFLFMLIFQIFVSVNYLSSL